MKYNKDILDGFLTEKVAINVETQQEWNDFMKLLEEETECKWSNEYLPTYHNHWTEYKKRTSVIFNFDGRIGLGFGTGYFFKEEGCEVIEYKDLIKGEETMTNIEKVNKALAGADESKIKEVLDFLGYKEDGKFIPKYEERYYFIAGNGVVMFEYFYNISSDEYRLLMGNVYQTKEEAKQALDFKTRKARLIKEIEDSSDVIDWGNEQQHKHSFWLDVRYNALRVDGFAYTQTQGTPYTTNLQFLEELIKTRPDEVKELLFDIKL